MNKQNILLTIIVAAIVSACVVVIWPHSSSNVGGAISPAGTTNSVTRAAYIEFQPTTQAGTTTSILNPVGNDVIIKSLDMQCTGLGNALTYQTGAGLANLIFTAATTSVPNNGLVGNTNYVMNTAIATSSSATSAVANLATYISSSTPGNIGTGSAVSGAPTATQDWVRVWPAGTYLTFASNATTTSTGSCNIGVTYLTE